MRKSYLLYKTIAISRFYHLIQLRNRIFLSFFFFFFVLFLICPVLLNLKEWAMSLGFLPKACPHHILLRESYSMWDYTCSCVCVCLCECVWVFVCVCNGSYLSFLQSTETNKYEELRTSQSLIQIPVVCQRTSGVIISWCLIVHLSSLSLPVVSLTYGVLIFKTADILRR